MKVEKIDASTVTVLRITDAGRLDPITVVLQDLGLNSHGRRRGRLIVECFGSAWSAYFGAMYAPLPSFVAGMDAEYTANNLLEGRQFCGNRSGTDEGETAYVNRIAAAVKAALQAQKCAPA